MAFFLSLRICATVKFLLANGCHLGKKVQVFYGAHSG